MILTPKNWQTFQHYKDRAPAWIKLHRGLLDDFAFSRLPVASRALAPLLWLLASEYDAGGITGSTEEIAFRLRMEEGELISALKPLVDKGFFTIDSGSLAECYQDAIPEKEEETQEREEEDIRAVADATRPNRQAEFDAFWQVYPKRDGANPKEPARKAFLTALKSGHSSIAIISGATRYREDLRKRGQENSPYVAQAVTWLRQARWDDYPEKPITFEAINVPAGFFVKDDTPQRDAWDAYHRQTKGTNAPRSGRLGGWYFPTEWPPNYAGALQPVSRETSDAKA